MRSGEQREGSLGKVVPEEREVPGLPKAWTPGTWGDEAGGEAQNAEGLGPAEMLA